MVGDRDDGRPMEIKAGQRLVMSELAEPGGTYKILAITEGEFGGGPIACLSLDAATPPRFIQVSTILMTIKMGYAELSKEPQSIYLQQ